MSSTPRSVWVSVSCVRSCGRESCLEYTGVFRIFDLLLLLLLLLLRPVVSPVSQYFFKPLLPVCSEPRLNLSFFDLLLTHLGTLSCRSDFRDCWWAHDPITRANDARCLTDVQIDISIQQVAQQARNEIGSKVLEIFWHEEEASCIARMCGIRLASRSFL